MATKKIRMGDQKNPGSPSPARRDRMTRGDVRVSGVLAILLLLALPGAAAGWGPEGHVIVTRAALAASDGLPRWFREAGDALAELSNAPDRWREVEKGVPALAARSPDHFFDLDVWGEEPLPPERWAYVERAARRRLRPAAIGFLPFAIGEEYGVLLSAFRDVQAGRAGGREAALAAAGVLAHLAGDAAVPLHATRHHHGWVGPNPEGFTRAGDIHRWFESGLRGLAGVIAKVGTVCSAGVTHEELRPLLADYAAGTLDEAGCEAVRRHLAGGCVACLRDVFDRPVGLPRTPASPPAPAPRPAPPRRGLRVLALAVGLGLAL